MNPSIQLKKAISLFLIALICLVISPMAQAVSPPPDGGYPNHNTAEGQDALFRLTTGRDNTAIGFEALFANTTGKFNTGRMDIAFAGDGAPEALYHHRRNGTFGEVTAAEASTLEPLATVLHGRLQQ